MTKKLYIAFYDDEEGAEPREAGTRSILPGLLHGLKLMLVVLPRQLSTNEVVDEFKRHMFGIDLTTVTDESTLAADAQDELDYLRQRAKDMHIEIQEGEIG
jgi:hypothetical protein